MTPIQTKKQASGVTVKSNLVVMSDTVWQQGGSAEKIESESFYFNRNEREISTLTVLWQQQKDE